MMNKYLVFAIISALAVGSILSTGGLLNSSVMAQDNMTMEMDNMSTPMDNMSTPMDNSTDMSNNTTTP
jgi:hypothetical protein